MTEPRYPLLVVEASLDDVDVLIGKLSLLGSDGIEERDNTTLTRGGELGATLIASFPDEATATAAYEELKGAYRVRRDELVGDAWRDAWKEHWKPTRITPRVVVVPSWLTYEPVGDDMVLQLDPGRAFGTGQHASTALAARAIERLVTSAKHPVIVDLGAGSGILSFVALMHGVPRAVACDIDAESVEAARENALSLKLTERFEMRIGGFDAVPESATLVVANIEASVLIPFAREVIGHVAPGGELVLSGILVEQRDDVVRAYEALGLVATRADIEGAWIAPEFHRP